MTKHILRAAEFLRDLVARLVIEVRHLSGRTMIADLLTEAVARVMYHELLRLFDAYAASYLTRRATIGRLANPPLAGGGSFATSLRATPTSITANTARGSSK